MTYEQEYELFLNHVNGLIERRRSVTATYLSVNAAVTAAIAFLFKDGQLQEWTQKVSVVILLIAGIAACTLWRKLIHHYSTTIGWWYGRLRHLEGVISESSKSITREYNELNMDSLRTRISTYEIGLIWLFFVVYSVFIVGIL